MAQREFGSIRFAGRCWQARWTDRDGIRRQKSYLRRADALRHLAAMKAEKEKASYATR
jgi:hypothetical protein